MHGGGSPLRPSGSAGRAWLPCHLGVEDSHGPGSERSGGGNEDDLADGHCVAAENTAADQRSVAWLSDGICSAD